MKINPKVIYRKIDNEYFVLEPQNNVFLNFNEVGNFIFEKIVEGKNEQGIINEVIENYSVDISTAEKDIKEFLTELKELKILDE